MADYVVGDLQGCYHELNYLLDKVDFNPSKDHLYLVGDIVARGPDSLRCMDFLFNQQGSVSITLGNHDLHFLATYFANQVPNSKDKLDALFASKKLANYVNFIQQQPLAIWLKKYNTLICHAGLSPELSLKHALKLAKKAAKRYSSDDAPYFLSNMYGNSTNSLSTVSDKLSKFCFTVNAFTRMRFVNYQGHLDFQQKGNPYSQLNGELFPWFNINRENHHNFNICFGHWAALLGETPYKNIFALDTGCVWGNQLTLMELESQALHTTKKLPLKY